MTGEALTEANVAYPSSLKRSASVGAASESRRRFDAAHRALIGPDFLAETVVRLGLAEACPHAVGALEVFAGAYGDEAATLALKCNAGVVYLTGGVTPHVLPALRTHFVPAFVAKGRYGPWLQQVPVRAVVHPDPGLVGAAVVAASLLGASGSEPGLPT